MVRRTILVWCAMIFSWLSSRSYLKKKIQFTIRLLDFVLLIHKPYASIIMRSVITIITILFFNLNLSGQEEKMSKTKFVIGLSGPELLHAGVTYRIANVSKFGINAGAGPSAGMIWTALSLEHRLYLGKNSQNTHQKTWFFRQGTTFFPAEKSSQQFTLNLSIGKDFVFKNAKNGITIDAGVFYLPESEMSSIILVRSLNLWPALRFEFYFSL
jgi:hypothetical protein